ncbi:MAG: RraA family protein [Gammaproteobacteria bacterium]
MTATLTQADLGALRRFDTPTICNAIELVAPARRVIGFTSKPFVCLDVSLPPMVGYARTATIRALEQPRLPADKVREKRLAYYDYVAAGPLPSIVVIQDLDEQPGFGAFWGEVHTTVHKSLGALGAITNGSFRDIDASAPGFQILGGMVNPSHAYVHCVDFGGSVHVHGMTVASGDLIHADRHGAVVIPHDIAQALPAAAELLARREKVILDACRAPGFNVEKLKAAIIGSAEIH